VSGFDFIEACKAAIAIDSTSEHGNHDYVAFLKTILSKFDLKIRTQDVSDQGYRGINLICEKGGGPDVILFDTHLDTVSPGDPSLWTETGGDPYRATIRDGKIFGLGSADVKLDFLCKLKALEPYVGRRFRNRFILLGTFGEEVGLLGAQAFLDDYQGQLDFALIGEPTQLKLVNRHKGRGCYEFQIPTKRVKPFEETIEIRFSGEAAHSSTPEKGTNAIDLAMDYLSGLDCHPTHLSIEGGHLLNIVPESCRVVVPASADLPGAPAAAILSRHTGAQALPSAGELFKFWARMRKLRETVAGETTWVCATARTRAIGDESPGFLFQFDSRFWEDAESVKDGHLSGPRGRSGVTCRVIRKTPSFFEASTMWYVEGLCGALEESGLAAEFRTKMASTEAALFGRRCTTLVFGPGPSEGNVHRPNEYNLISELESAIRAYDAILRRLVAVPPARPG